MGRICFFLSLNCKNALRTSPSPLQLDKLGDFDLVSYFIKNTIHWFDSNIDIQKPSTNLNLLPY